MAFVQNRRHDCSYVCFSESFDRLEALSALRYKLPQYFGSSFLFLVYLVRKMQKSL